MDGVCISSALHGKCEISAVSDDLERWPPHRHAPRDDGASRVDANDHVDMGADLLADHRKLLDDGEGKADCLFGVAIWLVDGAEQSANEGVSMSKRANAR